jgi:hypothetical protein
MNMSWLEQYSEAKAELAAQNADPWRTAGTFRRLSKIMAELGWTAVRVRDLTRGGYKEQVRGYCRAAQKDAH